jgi:hypothetical protein
LQRKEPEHREGKDLAPGSRRHAVALGNEQAGASEVTEPRLFQCQGVEVDWQFPKRTGAADDRLALGQPEPASEICGPPAARQLKERKRIAVALANDLVADRGIEWPVYIVQLQRARITVAEPMDNNSGSPARTSSPLPVRLAHTTAIRSANSRRATKPRICAEARSNHCTSSTMQTSGCSSAASANSVSDPRPDQEAVRGRTGAESEHGGERFSLGDW